MRIADVIVAFLDDVPDANGHIWSADAVKFPESVPLTLDFHNDTVIGTAALRRDGGVVKATLDVAVKDLADLEKRTPDLSGMIHSMTRLDRERVRIDDLTIQTIALCMADNTDSRICSIGYQLQERRKTIQVFPMNDCEWWAGETLDAVIAGMCEELSCEDKEELTAEGHIDEFITALTDDDLECLTYHDDENGEVVVRSFRAQLDKMVAEGKSFPCLFATTEY